MVDVIKNGIDFEFLSTIILGLLVFYHSFKSEIFYFFKKNKEHDKETQEKINLLNKELQEFKESAKLAKQELLEEINLLKTGKVSHEKLTEILSPIITNVNEINVGIGRLEGLLEHLMK